VVREVEEADGVEMTDRRVSVGSIVHYVSTGMPSGGYPEGACRAAVVTEVPHRSSEYVSLTVFTGVGQMLLAAVPHDETKRPGTWHWMEGEE